MLMQQVTNNLLMLLGRHPMCFVCMCFFLFFCVVLSKKNKKTKTKHIQKYKTEGSIPPWNRYIFLLVCNSDARTHFIFWFVFLFVWLQFVVTLLKFVMRNFAIQKKKNLKNRTKKPKKKGEKKEAKKWPYLTLVVALILSIHSN